MRKEINLYLTALVKKALDGEWDGTGGERELFLKNIQEPSFVANLSTSQPQPEDTTSTAATLRILPV